MSTHQPSNSAPDMPGCPFGNLWEDLDDEWVTFTSLETRRDEYAILLESASLVSPNTPAVTTDGLFKLLEGTGLEETKASSLCESLMLIAGFYLAPQIRIALNADLASSRKLLRQAAEAADRFRSLLGSLPPQLVAALHFIPSGDEVRYAPGAINGFDLARHVGSFSVAAGIALRDTAPARAGPRGNFHRDTALRLAIAALAESGLDDLGISEGSRKADGWHLTGRAGAVLTGQFQHLMGNGFEIESFARAVKRVRRTLR